MGELEPVPFQPINLRPQSEFEVKRSQIGLIYSLKYELCRYSQRLFIKYRRDNIDMGVHSQNIVQLGNEIIKDCVKCLDS